MFCEESKKTRKYTRVLFCSELQGVKYFISTIYIHKMKRTYKGKNLKKTLYNLFSGKKVKGVTVRSGKKKTQLTRTTKSNNQKITTYRHTNIYRLPFAECYRTKFNLVLNGVITTGTWAGINSYNMAIGLNTIYNPADVYTSQSSQWQSLPGLYLPPTIDATNVLPIGVFNLIGNTYAPYRIYRIFASKIILTIIPDVTSTSPLEVSIMPIASDATYTYVSENAYSQWSKTKLMTPQLTNAKDFTLTHYMKVAKFTGVENKVVQSDPDYSAAWGAYPLPSKRLLWGISLASIKGTTPAQGITYKVDVTYFGQLEQVNTTAVYFNDLGV